MDRLCKQPDMVEIPDTVSTLAKCEYFLNLASSEVNVLKFSWLISSFLEAAYSYFDVVAISVMHNTPSTYTVETWEHDEIFDKLNTLVHIESREPFGVTTAPASYSPILVEQLFKFHERYTHHFPLAILTAGPNVPEDFRFGDSIRNGAPVLEFCRKLVVFLRKDWLRGAKGFDQIEEIEGKKFTMDHNDSFFQASHLRPPPSICSDEILCKELDIVGIPDTWDTLEKCEYFLKLASREVKTPQFSWLISAFLEAAYSFFNVFAIRAMHWLVDCDGQTWQDDEAFEELSCIVRIDSKGPFGVTTSLAPYSPLIVRHLYKFHERYTQHFPLAILTGGPKLPEDFRFGDSILNGSPVLEFCQKTLTFCRGDWREKYDRWHSSL